MSRIPSRRIADSNRQQVRHTQGQCQQTSAPPEMLPSVNRDKTLISGKQHSMGSNQAKRTLTNCDRLVSNLSGRINAPTVASAAVAATGVSTIHWETCNTRHERVHPQPMQSPHHYSEPRRPRCVMALRRSPDQTQASHDAHPETVVSHRLIAHRVQHDHHQIHSVLVFNVMFALPTKLKPAGRSDVRLGTDPKA